MLPQGLGNTDEIRGAFEISKWTNEAEVLDRHLSGNDGDNDPVYGGNDQRSSKS